MLVELTVANQPPTDSLVIALYTDKEWESTYNVDGCKAACREANAMQTFRLKLTPPPYLANIDLQKPGFVFAALLSTVDLKAANVQVEYNVVFEQGDGSQVGVNERGLMTVYIIFTVLWALGLGLQLYAVVVLRRKQNLHPLVKIYTVTVLLWFLFVFCNMIHWSVYQSDGNGVPAMQGVGRVGEALARATFVLLLLLIGQGWTISTSVLVHKWRLLGAVGSVLVVYLALAIWYLAGRDPASTTYVYDSAPGIILCVLSGLLGIWFVFRVLRSFKNEVSEHSIPTSASWRASRSLAGH